MNSWKCSNCGYQYDAVEPSEECPSCGVKCEFVDVSNYVPRMDRTGRESRCKICGTAVKITMDGGGILKCCDQIMMSGN